MEEPAPLSLELRTLKKRQRRKTGIACLVLGLGATGLGVTWLFQPGAMTLAVWALAVGLALDGLGAYTLYKAATRRW